MAALDAPSANKPADDVLKAAHSESTSEPSSLWQTAYEHPVETGLAVAAAAGTAAALIASKGKLARLLAPRQQDVLVVEAAPYMGKSMRHALEQQGHRVTWVTEITKVKPFSGLTEKGDEIPLTLRRYHTAFVDPNHVHKSVPKFEELAPYFQRANVRTIGTSVMADVNQKMVSSGFDAAAGKPVVLSSLVGRQLDLRTAYRSPAHAREMLDSVSHRMGSPEFESVRQRTSELLKQYMS